jgi:hypothetical protein
MKNKLFVFSLVVLFACSDDNSELTKPSASTDSDYHVKLTKPLTVINGILHFDSQETFFNVINEISQKSRKELDLWEQSLGFLSLRTEVRMALDEIGMAETIESYYSILQKHSDLLEEQDDAPRSKVEDVIYQSIANRDGIFYVDGMLFKATKDHLLYGHNLDQLKQVEDHQIAQLKASDKIGVVNYISRAESQRIDIGGRTNSTCSNSVNAVHTEGDRRVILKSYFSTFEYGTCILCFDYRCLYETVTVNIKVLGEKKSIFGKWRSYVTSLEFADLNFKATVVENIGGSNYRAVGYWQPSISKSAPADDTEYWYIIDTKRKRVCYEGETVIGYGFFNEFSARFKSRGTPNWGTYSCQ